MAQVCVSKFWLREGVASPRNVLEAEKLMEEAVTDNNTILILHLFSNLVYRFEQFDGTLALPVWIRVRYHLPGPVRVIDAAGFDELLAGVMSILERLPENPQVLIPLTPLHEYRVLLGSCPLRQQDPTQPWVGDCRLN